MAPTPAKEPRWSLQMSREQDTLSQDTVFSLLSNARRRYVLYYLRDRGGKTSINELATQIAVWENDMPEEELSDQDVKRVYVSLYQTHIPKLEDWGIVTYDGDSGTVELTDRAGEVDRYLSQDGDGEIPWQLYYLAITVLGGVLFGLTVLEISVFGAVSPAVVGGLVIAAFAVSAITQYVTQRRDDGGIPRELRMRNRDQNDHRDDR